MHEWSAYRNTLPLPSTDGSGTWMYEAKGLTAKGQFRWGLVHIEMALAALLAIMDLIILILLII